MPDLITRIPNCLRIVRKSLTFFKGTFSSDLAALLTQVHVFEHSKENHVCETLKIDGEEGYQRPAIKSRQEAFRKYLKKNDEDTTFAPPVVLNARGAWTFEPYPGTPDYGELCVKAAANVIDGQHRLGGYVSWNKKGGAPRSVDFVTYADLSTDQEKVVFFTINATQKGVPGALSTIINIDKEWQNRVARRVAEESSSPFAGKIDMTGSHGQRRLFKLNSVAKEVKYMFRAGHFKKATEDVRYDIFVKYWTKIQEVMSDAWEDIERKPKSREHKLLELTGLIAFSRLFDDRFKDYYNRATETLDWDAVERDLEHLSSRIDLSKSGEFQGQTGYYGGARIFEKMQEILALRPLSS